MKKKEINETKTKSAAQLSEKIAQLEKERVETNMQIRMSKVKNVHAANSLRKDIARLKTFANLNKLIKVSKKEALKEQQNGQN